MEEEEMITLKSEDEGQIVVPKAAAMLSKTIRHMIEDDCTDPPIRLPNVRTVQVLEKVMGYCMEHAAAGDDEAALRDWDKGFIDVDVNMLHDVFLAVNYLHIHGLLHLAAEQCTRIIKGMSVETIRDTFNLTFGFTPEEEQEIRAEHPFAFL